MDGGGGVEEYKMLIKESEIMSSPLDDIQYIEQPIIRGYYSCYRE